jgi:hypothetical protein
VDHICINRIYYVISTGCVVVGVADILAESLYGYCVKGDIKEFVKLKSEKDISAYVYRGRLE